MRLTNFFNGQTGVPFLTATCLLVSVSSKRSGYIENVRSKPPRSPIMNLLHDTKGLGVKQELYLHKINTKKPQSIGEAFFQNPLLTRSRTDT